MKAENYAKFSSHLEGDNYFTQIDLDTERIIIRKEGVVVFDDSIVKFKKNISEGKWLVNGVYKEILNNSEKLMHILTKA